MSTSSQHAPSTSAKLSADALTIATLKGLAIDAIQAANSGHPGMPLGMADAAFVLWQHFLRFDPSAPHWPDRDRFVLSAGHGSMLQYALLHLYGYDVALDDLKQFRQLHSKTPGHPEYGHTVGVETTTGPLGQGIANAVGMALAEERLRAEFGEEHCDHWTYAIAGDGCMMEGVASEASSLAGHLGLGRLIVLYDSNHITIDGRTELTFTEDVAARYAAYNWHVLLVEGTDLAGIADALTAAKAETSRPTLIVCDTVIGRGSPKLAGSHKAHGAPFGQDEVAATKSNIGLNPQEFFAVDPSVYRHVRAKNAARQEGRVAWENHAHGERGQALLARLNPDMPALVDLVQWPKQDWGATLSTRKGGEKVMAAVAETVPQLLGGSADLGHSTFTEIVGGGHIQHNEWRGRNIHWGVREHAMGSICNGLAAHGGHIPVGSTFLVFHDYMRPATRLAALMGLQVVTVYTHDSIFVGEDGPTHQPIETLMAMRLIPNTVVLRPADLAETAGAWRVALLRGKAPTILALTRQNLPELPREASLGDAVTAVERGGYVLRHEKAKLQLVILATGSEVHLATMAQDQLEADGIGVRVVSMPSFELFDAQPVAYRKAVLPSGVARLSVEAGTTRGWERFVGMDGVSIGIDTFGASAPDKVLAKHFGFTVDNVVTKARALLG
jgi:transketolase